MAHTDNKALSRVNRHWDNLHFIDEIPMNQWSWVTCQEHNKTRSKHWPPNSKSITNYSRSVSKLSEIPVNAAITIRRADSLLSDGSWPIHKTIWPVSEGLFWHHPCPPPCLLSTETRALRICQEPLLWLTISIAYRAFNMACVINFFTSKVRKQNSPKAWMCPFYSGLSLAKAS